MNQKYVLYVIGGIIFTLVLLFSSSHFNNAEKNNISNRESELDGKFTDVSPDFVVPELPLGTLTGFISMILALRILGSKNK